jgi:hypothetical protein
MKLEKVYLGDSVYAECDGFGFWLTTENGLPNDPSNRIYLEPQILKALANYVDAVKKAAREMTEAHDNSESVSDG